MKTIVAAIRYVLFCALSVGALSMAAVPVMAQTPDEGAPVETKSCDERFLTFPAWYRGLTTGADCDIKSPTEVSGGFSGFIWTIVLNIIEIILNLAGYAAVAYIIYGGYKYMISAGSSDGMVAARKTIMNAVIGLIISIAAVAIVRTISNSVGLAG